MALTNTLMEYPSVERCFGGVKLIIRAGIVNTPQGHHFVANKFINLTFVLNNNICFDLRSFPRNTSRAQRRQPPWTTTSTTPARD